MGTNVSFVSAATNGGGKWPWRLFILLEIKISFLPWNIKIVYVLMPIKRWGGYGFKNTLYIAKSYYYSMHVLHVPV